MADLESLLNDLANLDAQNDFDAVRTIREQIIAEHDGTDEAVEAMYKLGLDFLFRQRDMLAAMESFAAAAKKKHPYWSAAARTSLGLCLYRQDRKQKALFELRRVAYPEKPSIHSVTALMFLENIFIEEGNSSETKRIRKDRIGQLSKLVDASRADSGDAPQRGYHLYQLGLAYRDGGDEKNAKEALEDAKQLGPDVLGADLYGSVVEACK